MQYSDYRVERKFSFGKSKENELYNFLLLNNFNKTFENRIVNSIYLDTCNFDNALDNINGVSNRKKLRMRWYNDDLNNLSFETKKKNNFCVLKKITKIKTKINKQNYITELNKEFKNNFKKKLLFNYDLVLLVSYTRKYLVSGNKKIRATIDYNIKVKSVNVENIPINLNDTILEFKFLPENEKYFREFFNKRKFNFRVQKFSKYVKAFSLLQDNGLIR